MKLSVVIPTYNRRTLLERTLPTVFSQELAANEYEVIVVVDGSTDGTAEYLRDLRPACALRVLQQENRGPAAARNAGARAARAPLLLFLDDDILCDPGLLKEHLIAHTGDEHRLVFGPVLVASESPDTVATDWFRAYTDDYTSRLAREGQPRWPRDAVVDANSSLPHSTFLASGGFDESVFRVLETTEMGIRLWKSGVRFCYCPPAVARQIVVKSARDIVQNDARWGGANEVLLSRKHPEYRSHSALARLAEGTFQKRVARQLAARLPVSPELFLRPVAWLLEPLRKLQPVRRGAMRWFLVRQGTMRFRSALRQVGSWSALRGEFGMQLPVLLYHHVGPRRPGTYPVLTVSPHQFERQVKWLKRSGYTGVRPSEWLDWCRTGKPLPRKPVLMTFDDAYADIAEYALPVLHRHGFGAMVAVVTSQIGGTNAWDESQGSETHLLMTAEQIREWAAKGIEFGTHSRTHRDLTTVSETDLQKEVAGSAHELGTLLGAQPRAFAYPYGPYNDRVVHCVRESFQLAFTCEEGLSNLRTDPYRLRRTMVLPGESLLGFSCRVRWGHNPIHRLRVALRPRTRIKEALQRLRGQPA